MARYVDTALRPDEKILYDAKVHWAIFIGPSLTLIVGILVAIGFFGGGAIARFQGLRLEEGFPFEIIGTIVPLVLTVVFVGRMASALIYYFNSDFVLTDRRVMSKFGLLSRTTSEQRLSKVESIHVYQSLLGRLLNFGNVTVTGTGSSKTFFGPMVDPIACKHAIEAQLDVIRDGGDGV